MPRQVTAAAAALPAPLPLQSFLWRRSADTHTFIHEHYPHLQVRLEVLERRLVVLQRLLDVAGLVLGDGELDKLDRLALEVGVHCDWVAAAAALAAIWLLL